MNTRFYKTTISLASFLFASGFFVSVAPLRADESKLTSKDKSFITDASEAGAAEIQLSELANKKSSNVDVKALADMMIADHTKAGADLDKIVTAKGGETSKSPGALQKADILLLEAKNGDSFDTSFAETMVSDHKKAVDLFTKASTDLDDADLKEFATATLPTLKHHLMEAEKLAAKLGK